MSELYKLLLVDDEDEVRGRIAASITEESGFQVVGNVGNGYDALDLIDKHKPDLVLSDIKMPYIDGIELAREIRKNYPLTKIIFLSGYDDFKYAQEAIDLKVVSYLMKPITTKEIIESLKNVKINIDKERKELRDMLDIKDKYNQFLPIVGESYLSTLLLKSKLEKSDIEKLKLYSIDVNEGEYVTCLFDIDNIAELNIEEIEKKKVHIRKIIENIFKDFEFMHTLITIDGIVLLLKLSKLTVKDVDQLLFDTIKTCESYLNTDILIGVSNVYNDFKSFPTSYKEVKRAIGYSLFKTFGRIVYESDIKSDKAKKSIISNNDLIDFEYVNKYGSDDALLEFIKKIENKLSDRDEFVRNYDYNVISLANLLISYASSVDVDLSQVFEESVISELSKYKDSDKMIDFISKTLFKIRELDVGKQVSKIDLLLQNTIKYIETYYNNPQLSLEGVCEEMGVSVSYLSMLLKKNKGITFNKYLIKTRMEKAKDFLSSDMKIVDIATLCGYNEVYYFSHSFKKYTGMSPREYRKNASN